MARVPHSFHTRMEAAGSMRKRERKSITARIPKIRLYSSSISSAFLGEMPRISVRRRGCFSITSRVWSPKASTRRRAMAGPIPLIAPEERYFKIAPEVAGRVRSTMAALNWLP